MDYIGLRNRNLNQIRPYERGICLLKIDNGIGDGINLKGIHFTLLVCTSVCARAEILLQLRLVLELKARRRLSKKIKSLKIHWCSLKEVEGILVNQRDFIEALNKLDARVW